MRKLTADGRGRVPGGLSLHARSWPRCLSVATLLVSLAWVPRLHAADSLPPPWRGQADTSFQDWPFSSPANPALPAVILNPFGGAQVDITVGLYGSGWIHFLQGLGTQTGYWDIGGPGGQMLVTIDGPQAQAEYAEVWVQVTYFKDISQPPFVVVQNADLLGSQTATAEQVPTGGAWLVTLSRWQVDAPQPGEQIVITSDPAWGAVIDELIADVQYVGLPRTCHDPFADADGDGDVDQTDFATWQLCYSGSGRPVGGDCRCFDRDAAGAGDGDVDADDYAAFQACASGPAITADAGCDGP